MKNVKSSLENKASICLFMKASRWFQDAEGNCVVIGLDPIDILWGREEFRRVGLVYYVIMKPSPAPSPKSYIIINQLIEWRLRNL